MEIVNSIYKYKQDGRSWYKRKTSQIKFVTVHHDAIPHSRKHDNTLLNQIKDTHVKKNWPGASYHYWISRTGTIHQLNELTDITWHDSKNTGSVGICLNGYFHKPHNNKPDQRQLDALYFLIDKLDKEIGVEVRGHRDVSPTACPGDNLYPLIHNKKEEEVDMGSKLEELQVEYKKEQNRLINCRTDRKLVYNAVGFDTDASVKDVVEEINKLKSSDTVPANECKRLLREQNEDFKLQYTELEVKYQSLLEQKEQQNNYPEAYKLLWRYGRVFVASFLTTFVAISQVEAPSDSKTLFSVITASATAGVVAVGKLVRDKYGTDENGNTDYNKLIHRLFI